MKLSKLRAILLSIFCVFISGIMLFMSKEVGDGISTGLTICTTVIIPSLLPFMVLTGFICMSSACQVISKPLAPITTKLFRLPSDMGAVILMSFIGGYPAAARILSTMVTEKRISSETASRMLCFCVNAGPPFIISAVGVGVFGSLSLGIVLLISQILSAIIIGILVSIKSPRENTRYTPKPMSVSLAFTSAVVSSVYAMLQICAFIIIFACVISMLKSTGTLFYLSSFIANLFPTPYLDSAFFSCLLSGLLEVTSGSIMAYSLRSSDLAFIITAFLVSFSGLSIIFQIMSCFKDTSVNMKPFIYSRISHGLLTASIGYPLYKHFVKTISVGYITSPPVMVLTPNSILLSLCMLSMCSIVIMSVSLGRIPLKNR